MRVLTWLYRWSRTLISLEITEISVKFIFTKISVGYNRNPMKIILEVKSEWKIFWPENDHFRIMLSEMIRKWSFSGQKIYFYCEFLKVTASFKFTVSYWLRTSASFILLTTRILCEKFTDAVSYNIAPNTTLHSIISCVRYCLPLLHHAILTPS